MLREDRFLFASCVAGRSFFQFLQRLENETEHFSKYVISFLGIQYLVHLLFKETEGGGVRSTLLLSWLFLSS